MKKVLLSSTKEILKKEFDLKYSKEWNVCGSIERIFVWEKFRFMYKMTINRRANVFSEAA